MRILVSRILFLYNKNRSFEKETTTMEEERREKSFFDELDKKEAQGTEVKDLDRIAKLQHTNNLIIEKLDQEPTMEMTSLYNYEKEKYSSNYSNYQLPGIDLLTPPTSTTNQVDYTEAIAKQLTDILNLYDIDAKYIQAYKGPRKTVFEFSLSKEIDAKLIKQIEERILENELNSKILVIPLFQRETLGIIVPNEERNLVFLRELYEPYANRAHSLRFFMGKRNNGQENIRLKQFQHLFLFGATGSGKSLLLHSIILSVLLQARPDEVKLLLIDPKKIEFTPYRSLPHLLAPVINHGEMTPYILQYIVRMMEKRLDTFSAYHVKDIVGYNQLEDIKEKMPEVLVIADEISDFVEEESFKQILQSILQLSKYTGVHLILSTNHVDATKRILEELQTGFNRKIAFYHTKTKNSALVLQSEFQTRNLLGDGDMVYFFPGSKYPMNLQGANITNEEIKRVADYCASQATPMFDEVFLEDFREG